jgi:hypothetical protein
MQLLEDLATELKSTRLNPLAIRMMPRDVVTRWNSTYDMLVFALEYRQAIDEISGDREMRKYELDDEEWSLVQQLCDVLEVCGPLFCRSVYCNSPFFPVVQGRNSFLFTRDTESCHRDSRDGSHRRPSCHGKPRLELLTCYSCFAGTWENPSEQIL